MWRANRVQTVLLLVLAAFVFYLLLLSMRGGLSSTKIIYRQCPSKADICDVQEFPCLVEGIRRLSCLKKDNEVYMPFFGFIQKQFQVTGKLDKDHFEYYTSYSKARVPESTVYNPFGEFGHFASYNVETRERVKCINAEYGVPMSIQWSKVPYFYPIQIAQFALQHYSRYKSEPEPRVVNHDLKLIRQQDGSVSTGIQSTKNELSTGSLILQGNPVLANLLFTWKPSSANSWFSVELEIPGKNKSVLLKYKFINDSRCVWAEYKHNSTLNRLIFVYSLGAFPSENRFIDVVLDLNADALKAISLVEEKSEPVSNTDLKNGVKLQSLHFYGSNEIRNPIRQQSSSHIERFGKAAEWFLKQQNAVGGWSVPTQRSIAEDRLTLEAGWHSAMAQGHGISVLVRAYHLNPDPKYISAIRKALQLFRLNATEGGVVNELFGNAWYEEYPTVPGTFVLNGFIYSLIGIYDATAIAELKEEANSIFNIGIASLKVFLPLYDSGSGSIYDLRHIGLKTAPNLARWDYHAVHIYLLKWLFNITGDKQFNDVADRWIGYAHGKMAKHN